MTKSGNKANYDELVNNDISLNEHGAKKGLADDEDVSMPSESGDGSKSGSDSGTGSDSSGSDDELKGKEVEEDVP